MPGESVFFSRVSGADLVQRSADLIWIYIMTKSKTHRAIWLSVLASILLHIAGLYMARGIWLDELETESFRARLANIAPLFKPRRLNTVQKPLLETPVEFELEYIAADREAVELDERELPMQIVVEEVEVEDAPAALREVASGAKEDDPFLERVKMLSPSELGLADSLGIPSMDLLRIVDMARANKDHAAVIVDRSSRRDLMGYVNFTQLRVYGAGSGRGQLDALTRYLRDNTLILANVREKTYRNFLSENLLKDPIHFLLQGGGLIAYRDDVLTLFSPEEMAMLERYMREGGFLFIEGDNRYLREMRTHLQTMLGQDAVLRPVPVTHPLYYAFYEFGGGFPGEDKTSQTEVGDNPRWYYPTRAVDEQIAAQRPTAFNQAIEDEMQAEQPPPLGIWGVELDGQLVAVLSDMGLMNVGASIFNVEDSGEESVLLALRASTNIIAYALTRDGGRTPQLPPAAWMNRRPVVGVESPSDSPESVTKRDEIDEETFMDLDASLALVQAPLGEQIDRDLQLRIDGRYTLELLKTGYNGVLLHNLPPGDHWIELSYGGEVQQLDFSLRGGKVLTLNFALNRFAFMSQLRLEQQDEQVGLARWQQAFSDLQLEEIYLAEDREWLEGIGSAQEVESIGAGP